METPLIEPGAIQFVSSSLHPGYCILFDRYAALFYCNVISLPCFGALPVVSEGMRSGVKYWFRVVALGDGQTVYSPVEQRIIQ